MIEQRFVKVSRCGELIAQHGETQTYELRGLAVNAFNNPANKQPRFGELNGFDLETVGIIVKSLHENGAIRGSAQ